MHLSDNILEKRQGYGAVTSGLTQAGDSLSDSASNATASLSQTQVIGVVVGIIVFAVLIIGLTWYCCVRTARRRTERREREALEDSQRAAVQQPLRYGDTVTIGMPKMAAAAAAPSTPLAHASDIDRRRGSEPDDDYWQHRPLQPAENQPGAGYVVDFDELGNPRYHQSQQHLPGYGDPVAAHSQSHLYLNTQERQPMYVRR